MTGRRTAVNEIYTVPVTAADRTKAGVAIHLVAARTAVPADQLTRRDRLPPRACRARWIAMYLSHVAFGWTLERVAHVFGLNRATAGAACRWVEDERDRAAFDQLLDTLEDCIRSLYAAPAWTIEA